MTWKRRRLSLEQHTKAVEKYKLNRRSPPAAAASWGFFSAASGGQGYASMVGSAWLLEVGQGQPLGC